MISLKRMVLFMLCVNLSCWLVAALFPDHVGFTPVIPVEFSDLENQVQNLTARDPLSMISLTAGYVWPMFIMIISMFGWALFGFPALLMSFGLPEVLTYPLVTLWGVCFVFGIIEFLGGRSV